jgi:hypothetical protein
MGCASLPHDCRSVAILRLLLRQPSFPEHGSLRPFAFPLHWGMRYVQPGLTLRLHQLPMREEGRRFLQPDIGASTQVGQPRYPLWVNVD